MRKLKIVEKWCSGDFLTLKCTLWVFNYLRKLSEIFITIVSVFIMIYIMSCKRYFYVLNLYSYVLIFWLIFGWRLTFTITLITSVIFHPIGLRRLNETTKKKTLCKTRGMCIFFFLCPIPPYSLCIYIHPQPFFSVPKMGGMQRDISHPPILPIPPYLPYTSSPPIPHPSPYHLSPPSLSPSPFRH
jgi:hypothetical protein